jgi:hypothetical protein
VPINTAGVTGSSGTYTYEHTTEVSGLNYIQFRNFGASAQNGINVTNWSAITIGLRVAPDAAQPGGGLTWYDTSNNFINLTLPATGVLWSVRTSGKTATDFTVGGNLFTSTTYVTAPNGFHLDTNASASLRYDDNGTSKWWLYKLNGDINLYMRDMVNARMQATFTPGSSSSIAASYFWSNLYVDSTTNSSAFNTGALTVGGGIGAGGAIFNQQNSNAIVNGLNAANTNTGNAATLRHTLTAGTNTSTIEAYSNGHATFPGRLRFGTNNGQMDFVPSGVLGLSISASALTTPVGLFTVSKAGAGSTVEINSDSGFTSKLSFQRAATNRWTFEADSADILAFKYLGTTSALSATSTSGNVVLTLGPAGAAYTHYLHGATAGGAIQFVCDPATTNRYLSLGSVNNSYVYTEMLRLDNTGAAFFTGSLNVGGQANFNGPFLTLNNTVQNRGLLVSTSGSNRWFVYVDGGTESGSNVGSNFSISAYSDAGGFLSTPVTIFRNSGRVVLSSTTNSTGTSSGALVVSGGVGVAGSINAGTTGTNYSHVFTGGDLGSGSIILAARDSNGTNQFIVGGSGVVQITNSLQLNGASNVFRIVNSQTPASQTATGTTGQITWDSSYIYVCTATNNWGRSSLSWAGGGGGGGGGSSNIWIPASEWIPRTTNGCGINSLESTTNRVNYDVLEFDPAVVEYAQAMVTLPNNWNAGTVTAKFHWTAASGSGDVVWQLSGRAYANDDAIDQATGTAQSSTDTLTAANDLDISPATSAITLAGTAANGNPVVFELSRNATAGGDTLAVDARLIGVEISYTI